MSDQNCVLSHRDEKPRRASVGLLCQGDFDRLERTVAELPSLHADLELALRRQATSGQQRVAGEGEEPPFVSGAVVDARAQVAAVLASWSRLVSEDRQVTPPGSAKPSVTAPFLLRHLPWLAAQPFADEVATELLACSSRAFSLAYPSGRRRITLGPCVEAGCDGTLTAVVRQTDDLLPSSIECDADEHSWDATQWLALGRKIHGREVA